MESFLRCDSLLWVPLPQQRPLLSAAQYFLLHLTKGRQDNWFSSLMFLLVCVSTISHPWQDAMCFHVDHEILM